MAQARRPAGAPKHEGGQFAVTQAAPSGVVLSERTLDIIETELAAARGGVGRAYQSLRAATTADELASFVASKRTELATAKATVDGLRDEIREIRRPEILATLEATASTALSCLGEMERIVAGINSETSPENRRMARRRLDELARADEALYAAAGDADEWKVLEIRTSDKLSDAYRVARDLGRTRDAGDAIVGFYENIEHRPEHEKVFSEAISSLRRRGYPDDGQGLPCGSCARPMEGYNDDDYFCSWC